MANKSRGGKEMRNKEVVNLHLGPWKITLDMEVDTRDILSHSRQDQLIIFDGGEYFEDAKLALILQSTKGQDHQKAKIFVGWYRANSMSSPSEIFLRSRLSVNV
jgi:hypothetical protein